MYDNIPEFESVFVFTPHVEDKGDVNATEYAAQLAKVSLDLSVANIGASISDIYTSNDTKFICIAVANDESAVVRKLYMSEDETEASFIEAAAVELIELIGEKAAGVQSVGIEITEDNNKITDEDKKPVNDVNPLWMKKPSECTDEEYKEFYTKVFMDFNEPLFWIHLNVDFPFRLKGILYFPKINHEFSGSEGQIKLFNNQVFVADNVKEVIPEFLMLLKGVLDCPDLPLNVSRSFLQNDGYVQKISSHITKKVADKLTGIFKKDRESFNSYWDDISIFIKYGCMRDEKLYEKIKDIIIYKTTEGEFLTLEDLTGDKKDIYYTSDKNRQSQYINLFTEQGIKVVELRSIIDTQFMSFVEMKNQGITFKRVDSNVSDLSEEKEAADNEKLIEIIKKSVPEDTKIEASALKNSAIPAIILLSEESRRMQEMYKAYGQQMAAMAGMFKDEYTLVLNTENSLIKKLPELSDEDASLVSDHIYDLAMLCNKPLPAERMTKFIERSNKIMEKLI